MKQASEHANETTNADKRDEIFAVESIRCLT